MAAVWHGASDFREPGSELVDDGIERDAALLDELEKKIRQKRREIERRGKV